MKKIFLLSYFLFLVLNLIAQKKNNAFIKSKSLKIEKNNIQKAIVLKSKQIKENDSDYEKKHKNSFWYKQMAKSGADYFAVKNAYDKYFGNYKWEKSKTRELGESWIKSKIFYLDKNGIVQDEPDFDVVKNSANKINNKTKINATTNRTLGTWTMIGPINSANTNYSVSGNHGGYVYLNRIDPTNPLKFFATFLTGGLWVTTDGGANWTLTDTNLPDHKYNDLDVCISTPSVVYAMTTSRVIKSTDGGFTWANTSLISSTYTGKAYDIAVSPNNPNIVVARWGDKIYRTIDGGTTWTSIISGLPNYALYDSSIHSEMLDWSTSDNNVVYFLSFSNSTNTNQVVVYRSGDAGATFSIIKTITIDPTANGQVVGWAKLLLPSNNTSDIYTAIGTGATAGDHHAVHLYKLNNTTGAEILKRVNMLDGLSVATGLHHGDISMDRTNENKIVYSGYSTVKIYYSDNNGVSFSTSAGSLHYDIRSVDMVNGKMMIGSDGESVISADNGATLTTITNSISNHELWGFGSAFKSDLVASGNNHGPIMIKEDKDGFEWYNGQGADQGNTDVNPLDDRYLYSQGYSNYRFFRTGVHTLINEANILDAGGIYSYFNSMEFHPNLYYSLITHHAGQYPTGNPNLATWKNSLIKTTDNGASISIVKTFSDQVFREKICMTNPNVMYTVVGLANNHVWKTTDGGINWVEVTPSITESVSQTNISDIAVSDVNPDEVWITYSGSQATCKVLKTINGGATWALVGTQSSMTIFTNTKIIFQRGSDGGVYVGNKSGIYYKNNSMPDWVELGNGLPQTEIRFMFINYNLGKLKIGTSRGAWEHNLYETNPPKAQISAANNKIVCKNSESIQFKDYSTVRNATATWLWSFPGGIPSTSTLENPVVSYASAANGNYNVSLTVTDEFGTNTQILTNFIEVNSNDCIVDTIPGKLLTLTNTGDYAQQSTPLNINTNQLSMSCWIKPNGVQSAFSGLIFSGSGNATGLNYYGTDKLGYHWSDNAGSYNFNSGLTIPVNVWSHIALVVWPDSALLYVNGIPSKRIATHPTVNFNGIFQFGIDRANTTRNYKGLMDEISIYNRSMTTNEIRELMHLTRNNPNSGSLPIVDASLIAYYQFNEGAGKPIYDKIGGKHAVLVGTALKSDFSTAPVGGGTFQRISIATGGLKDFSLPGVELNFPTTGTLPSGGLVVTRINNASVQLASPEILPNNPYAYYVIRNFGANQTISPLTSIKFKNISGTNNSMVSSPSGLKLFKRLSNDDAATWGNSIDDADLVTNNSTTGVGTISFSTNLNITNFSQFSIGLVAVPLSIQLISFTATTSDSKRALLNWKTAQDGSLNRFEIERSANAKNFTKIGEIYQNGTNIYSFTDVTPIIGLNYYRLKIVEKDGTVKYSEIKKVRILSKARINITPSADGNISFGLLGLKENVGLSISISNVLGQHIKTQYFTNIENNYQYLIGIDNPGVYIVRTTLTDGQMFSNKVVIVK